MNRNIRRYLLWIPVALILCFIFHNSLIPATGSDQESYAVTYWILKHLNSIGLGTTDFHAFHHIVRKLAHFTEYATLGFLVSLALVTTFRKKRTCFLLFTILPPILDELLQKITPGRSCQISDMILDASGFLFGALVFYILFLIAFDLRNRIAKPL